jgi:hypothetical protein
MVSVLRLQGIDRGGVEQGEVEVDREVVLIADELAVRPERGGRHGVLHQPGIGGEVGQQQGERLAAHRQRLVEARTRHLRGLIELVGRTEGIGQGQLADGRRRRRQARRLAGVQRGAGEQGERQRSRQLTEAADGRRTADGHGCVPAGMEGHGEPAPAYPARVAGHAARVCYQVTMTSA